MLILTLPPTTNHTYHHHGHTVYMTKEAKDWQRDAVWLLKAHKGENPTSVSITYYLKRERDVDGSHKIILDAMTKAGVMVDDKLIIDVDFHKRWNKINPRVEVSWSQ